MRLRNLLRLRELGARNEVAGMLRNLKSATLPVDASIAAAFETLNDNKLGIVFLIDDQCRVTGCITDGDIRRQLLQNSDLSTPVVSFMNRDFVRADSGAPREHVLKLLDHGINVIPLLDKEGRLAGLCSRSEYDLQEERGVFARARAPARISFGGGGSDLTHYFLDQGGMVISCTITKFAYAALRRRQNGSIRIYSHDLKIAVEAENLTALPYDGKLDLIKSVAKLINPDYGFELEVGTDFPVGSGLGGSAALAVAIIGCFNEFRTDPWTRHQIAEMAFQCERLLLDIPGGWQDQYAAAFGGFNYMEFTAEENLIIPLRLEPKLLRELEAGMILCYTRRNHNSGNIHSDQKKKMATSVSAQAAVERQKSMTLEMKRLLLRGDVFAYGRKLHEAWISKREMSDLITNSELDRIYDHAITNGALGGKLLGAGGGGYFMFFAPPFERYRVCTALNELGYETERVTFDEGGLLSWKVREPQADATLA